MKKSMDVKDCIRSMIFDAGRAVGGSPDAAIEILLNDRKMWIERIYGLQKAKKEYQGQGNDRDRTLFSDLCHEYSDAAQRV